MGTDDNIHKSYNPKPMYTRLLMVWIPFLIIGLVLVFLAGVAYFLLWILIFHFMITSVAFVSRIGNFMLGKQVYKISHDALIEMGRSKKYRIYWVTSNIFWLVVTIISFNYNLRVVDFF